MCMVIYKPKDATLNTAFLDICALKNPHGSGYMFNDQGVIHGIKGFMEPSVLYAELERTGFMKENELVADRELVIHFRLATHGGISPSNCHPFPISRKIEDLKSLSWKADVGMAHNGIIPVFEEISDLSDTQIFIRDILSQPNLRDNLREKEIQKVISNLIRRSRLILFIADGTVITLGQWINEGNILFSNDPGVSYPKG